MFDALNYFYKKIITDIGIVGYLEEDIIKRGFISSDNYSKSNNLPLNLLYSYPNKNDEDINSLVFQLMFPDDNHNIQFPKFFSLTLTNEQASHSFLYCLKFSEKYTLKIEDKTKYVNVPLVIYIKSEKEDLESFKQLLYTFNQIIANDTLLNQGYDYIMINNYKKVQLMNLFHFIFSLPHPPPHSLIKLQLNTELENLINNTNLSTIDFYFSSNCEIPCNKNDTDINILFLILDQSIIIKVLFAILTEKQIIFIASQAYILHLIISTFLKLIFPFKWMQSCITVLPKENLDLLDIPGSYIFGILSDMFPSTKDVLKEYPGKIVVDCDTNEIFEEGTFEPYIPAKLDKNLDSKKKEKSKEKSKDKSELKNENYDNENCDNFCQGNNLIYIKKNGIYKYDSNNKKVKLNFENDNNNTNRNNIIIDIKQSQMFIDRNDIYIDSIEWKELRRNIQLVRNPEIFDLDNFNNATSKHNSMINDENCPILQDRPFSYNIQNIFMNFILKKLTLTESEFMTVFKKTNLYLTYNDVSKKFQNNSGYRIVKNIEDTKLINAHRSIDNCFNIEYVLNPFNVNAIVDKIDSRINPNSENNNENVDQKLYKDFKKIFIDYFRLKEEIKYGNNNDNDIENYMYYSARKQSVHCSRNTIGSGKMKIKNLFSHVKNNKSLLQETSSNNNYILLGVDKDSMGSFQFYTPTGFLVFLNKFDETIKKENINLHKIVYADTINKQISKMIKNLFNEMDNKGNFINKQEKENEITENNTNNNINTNNVISDKELRKALGVSIVPETTNEVENEDNKDNNSEGSVKIKKEKEDYDFMENVIDKMQNKDNIVDQGNENRNSYSINSTNIIENNNENKIKGISINLNEDNNNYIIINFPFFDYEAEKLKLSENDNEINLLMQYLIFLAFYLEEIKKDSIALNELFQQKIFTKDNIEIKNVNELIIKLYIIAHKFSGKKHRDYPYFSYYSFLAEFDSEELKTYNFLFNTEFYSENEDEEDELYEIYKNVIIEKEKNKLKQLQKLESLSYCANIRKTSTNYTKIKDNNAVRVNTIDNSVNSTKNISKLTDDQKRKSCIVDLIKKDIKRQSVQISPSMLENIVECSSGNIFNPINVLVINRLPDFETINSADNDIKIISDIANLLMQDLPKKDDLKDKNVTEILEETHNRIIENKKLFKLIGALKYLKLSKCICNKKQFLYFWLNSFNYLLLFTIFYTKANFSSENFWKHFFKNIKFNIDSANFSFNDMQYILFKKPLFFSSGYKAIDEIKKYAMEKVINEKGYEENLKAMFLYIIYIPVKKFNSIFLFDLEKDFDEQFNMRKNNFINELIFVDDQKILHVNEFIWKFEGNSTNKILKKYSSILNKETCKYIEEKKYKKRVIDEISWKLNFEYLYDE